VSVIPLGTNAVSAVPGGVTGPIAIQLLPLYTFNILCAESNQKSPVCAFPGAELAGFELVISFHTVPVYTFNTAFVLSYQIWPFKGALGAELLEKCSSK